MKTAMIFITLILMIQSVSAIGIGISPGEMIFEKSLKGATYENVLTIINMENEEMNYSLSASGDIENWVNFYYQGSETKIQAINVPANGKNSVIVKFSIPSDAASKNYSGELIARSIPVTTNESGSRSSLIVGGSSQVIINVTGDQIMDGIVNGIFIENIEPGIPLKIETRFRNLGNVIAVPEIDVAILQDGKIIANVIQNQTKIKPSISDTITAEWITSEKNIPGDYLANVLVSLDGKKLKSDNLTFKILPVGTLTRRGNLTKIFIDGKPVINVVTKVYALFENTGEIDTAAKFKGELYQDGALIDTLESDELVVNKQKDIDLLFYVKPSSYGDYTIKGMVIYSGKKTDGKEISFKVEKAKSIPGFGVEYALVTIIALMLFIRRKNKNNQTLNIRKY